MFEGNAIISLDLVKINHNSKWDGLKDYITNVSLNPQEIIEQYRQLWPTQESRELLSAFNIEF